MTNEDKKLREHMSMSAFTFYIDDLTKLQTLKKLREFGIDNKKGSLSALLRVLLRNFAETDLTEQEQQLLRAAINEEYVLTTKKSKRSSM